MNLLILIDSNDEKIKVIAEQSSQISVLFSSLFFIEDRGNCKT